MLSVILILIVFSAAIKSENICQITVPIGQWLQNNTRSCEKVKGHFILDETANNFTQEIFSTFKGLKSIEGCLYVKGFNGSNNLSFFGNLTDVVCKQKQGLLFKNPANFIFQQQTQIFSMLSTFWDHFSKQWDSIP